MYEETGGTTPKHTFLGGGGGVSSTQRNFLNKSNVIFANNKPTVSVRKPATDRNKNQSKHPHVSGLPHGSDKFLAKDSWHIEV